MFTLFVERRISKVRINLAVHNERKCWIDVVSVSATSVVCSKLYVRITQNP